MTATVASIGVDAVALVRDGRRFLPASRAMDRLAKWLHEGPPANRRSKSVGIGVNVFPELLRMFLGPSESPTIGEGRAELLRSSLSKSSFTNCRPICVTAFSESMHQS